MYATSTQVASTSRQPALLVDKEKMVNVERFELSTPRSQTECSIQAELHTDNFVKWRKAEVLILKPYSGSICLANSIEHPFE